MTCAEAGRRGGNATMAKHGIAHVIEAGAKGQAVLRTRYGREDRKRWGAMGGRPRRKNIKV